MSWIDRLAPFRKGGSAVAEAVRDEAVNGSLENGPPLICLVNDASGRASFKTHVFPDSESATDFVLYWFPDHNDGGLTAFWAMTSEPEMDGSSDITVEPLVMVRDLSRDGVVYLFSFSDIESAQAFLRDEVQHGTDLGSMMLYWAVPVRMAADPRGKMRLTPAVPPGALQDFDPEAPESDMWTLPPVPVPAAQPQEPAENSRTIFQEAPNAYSGVAKPDSAGAETFELTAWMERARKKPSANSEAYAPEAAVPPRISADVPPARAEAHREPPPEAKQAAFTQQTEMPEITAPASVEEVSKPEAQDHASVQSAPIIEDVPAVFRASESAQPLEGMGGSIPSADSTIPLEDATNDAIEDVILFAAAPVAEQESKPSDEQRYEPEETMPNAGDLQTHIATIHVQTNGNGHSSDAEDDNGHTAIEPAEIVVHQNGHSAHKPAEIDSDPTPPATTEAEAHATEEEDGDHGVDIRIDIRLESSRAMKIKRWAAKEDPFEGFNSPPGRF